MLIEGNIIYFDPFYFKNGNTAKPKYFVVLKIIDTKSILASLPTRKNLIPFSNDLKEGCIELPEINLNCFVFKENIPITTCEKSFQFNTFIYGHQLDDYEIDLLNENHPNEGIDYEVWGKMKNEIFIELINCLKNSKSIKHKYKRKL